MALLTEKVVFGISIKVEISLPAPPSIAAPWIVTTRLADRSCNGSYSRLTGYGLQTRIKPRGPTTSPAMSLRKHFHRVIRLVIHTTQRGAPPASPVT